MTRTCYDVFVFDLKRVLDIMLCMCTLTFGLFRMQGCWTRVYVRNSEGPVAEERPALPSGTVSRQARLGAWRARGAALL